MPALSACAVHDPRSLRPWLQVLLWLALMGYAAIWLLGTCVVFAFLLGVTFMLSAAFFGPIAALSGKVLVYQERVGSRLGADPPAAVGFEVKLVAPDGIVLWEGNYYEKQRPMTEDFLGFVQRYGVFVTAEELAAYGAEELADAFPYGGAAGGGK